MKIGVLGELRESAIVCLPVMEIGESSIPSLSSFKEEKLCQKPSSTELFNGANWRIVGGDSLSSMAENLSSG